MNLLSSATGGALTVLIFLFCFSAVAFVKLAWLGFFSINVRKSDEKEKTENKNEPEVKNSEPVYYIVERKKKIPKKNYSEPKKISFR